MRDPPPHERTPTLVDNIKIVAAGACAVVIGLAWKDYIMDMIRMSRPFVTSRLKIHPHLVSLIFMIIMTVVLTLVIHMLGMRYNKRNEPVQTKK